MSVVTPSTKEQLVVTAERLLAERGIDGVSLRQIGAEAGNGNNSAVQYHFGSKEKLVEAIFEYRLPRLYERRNLLLAERSRHDLRSLIECYALPILEQAELPGSNYCSFVAMLRHHSRGDVFERISLPDVDNFRGVFSAQQSIVLPEVPEPLRSHRFSQMVGLCIYAAAERERARTNGEDVLPFAVFVHDLIDGMIGFLQAPISPA